MICNSAGHPSSEFRKNIGSGFRVGTKNWVPVSPGFNQNFFADLWFRGVSSVFVRVAMWNSGSNHAVNTYTDDYIGFIGFSKKFCGIDFLRAFDEQRIAIDILDNDIFYHLSNSNSSIDTSNEERWNGFLRIDGRHSQGTISTIL